MQRDDAARTGEAGLYTRGGRAPLMDATMLTPVLLGAFPRATWNAAARAARGRGAGAVLIA